MIKLRDLETRIGKRGQLGDLNFSKKKSLTVSNEKAVQISRGKIINLVIENNIVNDFNSKGYRLLALYFSLFEVVVI